MITEGLEKTVWVRNIYRMKEEFLTARCSCCFQHHWLDKLEVSGGLGEIWGTLPKRRYSPISLQVGKQTSIWKRCSAHLLSHRHHEQTGLYWKPATLRLFRELLNIKGRRVASFSQKSGERRCLYVHKYVLSTQQVGIIKWEKKFCIKCVLLCSRRDLKAKADYNMSSAWRLWLQCFWSSKQEAYSPDLYWWISKISERFWDLT